MVEQQQEGKVTFYAPQADIVSKDLEVFYNPVMEYNRTLSIEVLRAFSRTQLQVALPLAGSGIRGVRMLAELPKNKIQILSMNDVSSSATKLIKKNLKANNLSTDERVSITTKDANEFLSQSYGFDYIDIDPFGSPNKFLHQAIDRLSRDSILAVSATDTGALCGTYRTTCRWKYWAEPLHTDEMHEVGLRILIRKVQLLGLHLEKALVPLISYSKDHYMRVFFHCTKSKKKCNEIFLQHQLYKGAGPLWVGPLKDQQFLDKISLDDSFTQLLKEEKDILGFYDISKLCKKIKKPVNMKFPELFAFIEKAGYEVSRTQFGTQTIKTSMPEDELLKLLKK